MIYVATYLRASPADPWPLDHGDDPSFGSSCRLGGRVTWGVCRPDVRNALRPGDAVIFFAADRLRDRRPARYQFVGFATVDRGVRQTDVWTDRTLRLYRHFGNLLIRPVDGGFQHFEPELPQGHWHKDWLWRISERAAFEKDDFGGLGEFSASTKISGRSLCIAPNYIVFTPEGEGTFVLADPPVVASVEETGRTETWLTTPFASALRPLILGSAGRCLRTTNRQVAHRHIRIQGDAGPLFSRLQALCVAHGLAARDAQHSPLETPSREPGAPRSRVC